MSLRRQPASAATYIPRAVPTANGFGVTSTGALGFAEDVHTEHALHSQIQQLQQQVKQLAPFKKDEKAENVDKSVTNNREAFQKLSAKSWPKSSCDVKQANTETRSSLHVDSDDENSAFLGVEIVPNALWRNTLLGVQKLPRYKPERWFTIKNLKRYSAYVLYVVENIENFWKAIPAKPSEEWLKSLNHKFERSNLYEGNMHSDNIFEPWQTLLGAMTMRKMSELKKWSMPKYLTVAKLQEQAKYALWEIVTHFEQNRLSSIKHSELLRLLVMAKLINKGIIPDQGNVNAWKNEIEEALQKNGKDIWKEDGKKLFKEVEGMHIQWRHLQGIVRIFDFYSVYTSLLVPIKDFETSLSAAHSDAKPTTKHEDVSMEEMFGYVANKTFTGNKMHADHSHKYHHSHHHPNNSYSHHQHARGHQYEDSLSGDELHEEADLYSPSKPISISSRREEDMFCRCNNPVPVKKSMSTGNMFCRCINPIPVNSLTTAVRKQPNDEAVFDVNNIMHEAQKTYGRGNTHKNHHGGPRYHAGRNTGRRGHVKKSQHAWHRPHPGARLHRTHEEMSAEENHHLFQGSQFDRYYS